MERVWLTEYLKGMVKLAVVLSYFQRLGLEAEIGYSMSLLLATVVITLWREESDLG